MAGRFLGCMGAAFLSNLFMDLSLRHLKLEAGLMTLTFDLSRDAENINILAIISRVGSVHQI